MRALRQSPRPVRGALHLHRGHAWHAQARLGLKPVESRGPSQAPARPLAEVAVRGLKGWWSSGRGGGDPGVHCWEPWWGRQTRGADLWGRRVLEAAVASFHRPALLPHEVRLCAVSCHLLTARLLGLQNPVGHRPRRQGATPAQGLCGGGDIGRICEEEGSLGLSTGADVSGGGHTDPPSESVGLCGPWRVENLPTQAGLCFRGGGGPKLEERADPRGICTPAPVSLSAQRGRDLHFGFAQPRVLIQLCS